MQNDAILTTASLAARLIRVFEGCKLVAYWDRTGKTWTVGFGHTLTAHEGMRITQAQADEFLVSDCAPLLDLVTGLPLLKAAVLVSFGYNCGIGALRRVMSGEIQLQQYGRTSGGVELPGLAARRDLEAALIESATLGT